MKTILVGFVCLDLTVVDNSTEESKERFGKTEPQQVEKVFYPSRRYRFKRQ